MMRERMAAVRAAAVLLGLLTWYAQGNEFPMVIESARQIPIIQQVDVVVVGGSSGAVAVALETLGDPAGAAALARLLALPGMAGHELLPGGRVTDGRADDRNAALKEIVLARALYRCGDHGGLGERILRQYAGDLRGVFARHATAVLESR